MALGLFQSVAQKFTKKGRLVDLFPGIEMQGAARVLKAVDPVKAQAGRRVSNLAEVEVWAHGLGDKTAADRVAKWQANILPGQNRPVQALLHGVTKEMEVNSVLLSCCNIERQVVAAPAGKKAFYGLGLGYHNKYQSGRMAGSKLGGAFAWEHAVAIAEGESSKIYTKGSLYRALQEKNLLPAAAEDRAVIGIFKDAQGKVRLGANVLAQTEQEILASSLPIEQVPHITAKVPTKGNASFEFGGRSFSSFENAKTVAELGAPSIPVAPRANGSVVNVAEGGVSTQPKSTPRPRGKVAAVDASLTKGGSAISENAQRQTLGHFKPTLIGGLVVGGAVIAGALLLGGNHQANRSAESPSHGTARKDNSLAPDMSRGKTEDTGVKTDVVRGESKPAKSSTTIELHDAPLNMTDVDDAFANHLRFGYAYGS